jgi:hypothetical protein
LSICFLPQAAFVPGSTMEARGRESRIARADHAEFAREQKADLLAFADRNREIVELPPGLENGLTRNRMR